MRITLHPFPAVLISLIFFSQSVWGNQGIPENSSGSRNTQSQNLRTLQKEIKKRYREVYLSANKPLSSKNAQREKIESGWKLFNEFCRFCHGYSEKAGERAEMLLNPALNDDGKLAKTPAEFLKRIYFGGKKMPAFGMGSFKGEITASPEGYKPNHGSRRLTPEEALDIAYYLRFCFQIPGSVKWGGVGDEIRLDMDGFR